MTETLDAFFCLFAKAPRQMLRALSFSLVGFGELSEVVEKEDQKDDQSCSQDRAQVQCTILPEWAGLSPLGSGKRHMCHLGPAESSCGPGHYSHVIPA